MPAPLPSRLPVSTYRLQLNGQFTMPDAAAVVPYLDQLGITDLYSSPILAARPGTTHGYDICDHSRINPQLGGDAGLDELAAQLQSHQFGYILDFVPNHMSIDETQNLWWRDVLENGPSSPFAHYFDIDWEPVKSELRGKVLLPILGDQYGNALDTGQLQIDYHGGDFWLRYFDHNLPLNPRHLPILFRYDLNVLQAEMPVNDSHLGEFLSILVHLDHLPAETTTDPGLVAERQREKEVAKRRLATLLEESPRIRRHIEDNIRRFNGKPGDAASFDLLHELLEAQPYRISFWRTAMHEINYRRFFDINDLAGIRMEDRGVFQNAHELVLGWIRQGIVTGLRLDHVDGLFDPAAYFRQLHESCGETCRIYVVAEKILSPGERLRDDWAIHGTTGYDFLNTVNSVFVDRAGAHEFRKLYTRIRGTPGVFSEVAYASKKLIVATSMASELYILAHDLNRISESDRHYRDYTLSSLQDALTEVVACFPVYRTYFHSTGWDEFDLRNVEVAIQTALRRNLAMEGSIFQFIREMLLPERKLKLSEQQYERRMRFAMKFQQYTGPVQAKGLEDTAFYRYGPLVSLNEVGGDPGYFGISVQEFHQANRERLERFPLSVLATSTHDTKRGEDARARLNILSEIPKTWREMVTRWARINSSARTPVRGDMAPDRSDEYLYYQALLGAWPADCGDHPEADFVKRMRQYMHKATQEKKVQTSWINPSADYDAAVANFVEQTLAGTRSKPFLAQFLPFEQRIAFLGMMNSLSQLILKIASPGVADFYQGAELWDVSLVDPDNRRPVDFAVRASQLEQMLPLLCDSSPRFDMTAAVTEMLEHWTDGRIKQFLTAAGLRFRRQHSDLFLRGDYVPITVAGKHADHVVSFARTLGQDVVLAVAPRLVATLVGPEGRWPFGQSVWDDTELELSGASQPGSYRNLFTGAELTLPPENRGRVGVADVLGVCPVALLASSGLAPRVLERRIL
jgi:(1->4)-alpha-D-glucan 1-alpha-D-glucosylmutase